MAGKHEDLNIDKDYTNLYLWYVFLTTEEKKHIVDSARKSQPYAGYDPFDKNIKFIREDINNLLDSCKNDITDVEIYIERFVAEYVRQRDRKKRVEKVIKEARKEIINEVREH